MIALIRLLCLTLFLAANTSWAAKKQSGRHATHRPSVQQAIETYGEVEITTELDIFNGAGYLNFATTYTSKDRWLVGVQAQSIPTWGDPGVQSFNNDLYLQLAKTWNLSDRLELQLGTQNDGTYFAPRQLHSFSFVDLEYEVNPRFNLHAGTFFVNKALSQTSSRVGFQGGVELTLIPKTLNLQVDYLSGHDNASGATANLFYHINRHASVYGGVMVPETNSGNAFGGAIGMIIRL